MRYLRMLTNAIAGAVLMAAYVAVLVFQLNPQLPVVSWTALAWLGAMVAFYAPYLSVALFFLMLGRDLLSTEPLRPAWLSVRILAWFGVVGAGAAAALTWTNLAAFSTILSRRGTRTDARRRLCHDRLRRRRFSSSPCCATRSPVAEAVPLRRCS